MNNIFSNKEQLQHEFDEIIKLQNVYKNESQKDPNSRWAIDAYLDWYNKVYVVCQLIFGAEDADVIAFEQVDNSENGYGLERNYNKLGKVYTMLQYRMKMILNGEDMSRDPVSRIEQIKEKKSPLLFISHASADKEFASALVTLLEQQGFTHEHVFCSSVDGYGFDVADDIYSGLLKKFHEYQIFVLFVHSPRFYQRYVTLNEMGAAWVLKTQHASILTPDMQYADMNGVVNNHEIAVKVNAEDAQVRMTQMMNQIRAFFGKEPVNSVVWERQRNEFLERVNNMVYTLIADAEVKESYEDFTEEQVACLKNWVQSGETELYIIPYKGGLDIEMGNSYSIANSEEEIEWRDFIEKLEEMGFIKHTGRYQDEEPIYRRTGKLTNYFFNK